MENNYPPAFPITLVKQSDPHSGAATETEVFPGLTMRDYFAAAALQGILANDTNWALSINLANKAYDYADAMMEARNAK